MDYYGSPAARLIEEMQKLPGVGIKSAQRMAFYILNSPPDKAKALADAIMDAKDKAKYCKKCHNLTDTEICYICKNTSRDNTTIMVVESPQDMAAYEKTKEYKGLYHILHGAISPMEGIGPDQLRIKPLLARLNDENDITKEIIIATNPNIEGEATAMYLSRLLRPLDQNIKITRIAHGVPVGGDLEYVDSVTLLRALQWRREM